MVARLQQQLDGKLTILREHVMNEVPASFRPDNRILQTVQNGRLHAARLAVPAAPERLAVHNPMPGNRRDLMHGLVVPGHDAGRLPLLTPLG